MEPTIPEVRTDLLRHPHDSGGSAVLRGDFNDATYRALAELVVEGLIEEEAEPGGGVRISLTAKAVLAKE